MENKTNIIQSQNLSQNPIQESSKSRKGRKIIEISWPNGDFTIDELQEINEKISRTTLHLRINKALEEKEIVLTDKTKDSGGRPSRIFSFASKETGQKAQLTSSIRSCS